MVAGELKHEVPDGTEFPLLMDVWMEVNDCSNGFQDEVGETPALESGDTVLGLPCQAGGENVQSEGLSARRSPANGKEYSGVAR